MFKREEEQLWDGLGTNDNVLKEIQKLWEEFKYQGSLEAREALIEYYLPFVERMVRKVFSMRAKLVSSELDMEDLISIGTIALIKAIDNFELDRGIKFEHYAYKVIFGYVSNYIDSKLPIPSKSYKRLKRQVEELKDKDPEKAKKKMRQLIVGLALAKLISLEATVSAESDTKLIELLDGSTWINPHELMENKDILAKIKQLLDRLTPMEKYVIVKHYYEGVKFIDIAGELAISKQRVSQLHNNAIKKLRSWLMDEG